MGINIHLFVRTPSGKCPDIVRGAVFCQENTFIYIFQPFVNQIITTLIKILPLTNSPESLFPDYRITM